MVDIIKRRRVESPISRGTSWGMRRWYRTRVPHCGAKGCRTYLVAHDRRKRGLCAACEAVRDAFVEVIDYGGRVYVATYISVSRGRLVRGRRYILKPLYAGGAAVIVGNSKIKEFLTNFCDFSPDSDDG